VEYLLSSPAKTGWQPDIVYTRNGRPLPESDAGLVAALTGAGIELPEARKGLQRVAAIRSTDTVTKLFNLNVAGRWTESPMYAGLLRRADLKASAERRPFVAVIPLHAGRWRNGQYEEGLELQIVQLPNQQVAFRAPLTAPARRDSYLHTGEFDTTLPASMVRRVWCIMTGPAPTSMQALWDTRLNHGYVSLDDYEDWILDWRADPKVTYPRLFFTADDVKRARQNADSNPYKEQLLALPYFSDDPAVAQQLAEKATKGGRFAEEKAPGAFIDSTDVCNGRPRLQAFLPIPENDTWAPKQCGTGSAKSNVIACGIYSWFTPVLLWGQLD
jgi:hypothetical protein